MPGRPTAIRTKKASWRITTTRWAASSSTSRAGRSGARRCAERRGPHRRAPHGADGAGAVDQGTLHQPRQHQLSRSAEDHLRAARDPAAESLRRHGYPPERLVREKAQPGGFPSAAGGSADLRPGHGAALHQREAGSPDGPEIGGPRENKWPPFVFFSYLRKPRLSLARELLFSQRIAEELLIN